PGCCSSHPWCPRACSPGSTASGSGQASRRGPRRLRRTEDPHDVDAITSAPGKRRETMTFSTKRAGALAALAVTVALVATGCAANGDGGDGGTGGDGDANLAITFLPKNLGNP